MLFGRTLRLPCDILFGRPSDTPSSPSIYLNNLEARLESVHAFARERIKLASERMKTRYDSGATGHHFKEGDKVWMYNPKRRRGLSPKLQQNWEGLYTIVKKLNDVIYKVQMSPNTNPKAYRSADHEATGCTPTDMLFGRTLRLPCDILFGRPSDTPSSPSIYLNNLEARLESVHAFARERIKLASERMKTRYDSGATGHHFKEGDKVWMYNPKRRRGLSPKLQQNWEGLYTIVKKLNDVIYKVQMSPNTNPKVIHINRLTPYRATDHR
ncbi:hypothetical protein AVEN_271880-1 [Araneus ventricosus]|uniref:Integrase p58-like C-terminal domain-containing protein n=1 Tax=Araneus ventricosus TaxID=182803 RepID=A0A4Y2B851_ARAVE|nr:hypothetical protein AVEN_271880-1 [Araneus ventricosus]